MTMNRAPAFQFYAKDWMDYKVLRMTYEGQGIYMRILCHMWKDSPDQCSFPKDPKIISRILGISEEKWKEIYSQMQESEEPLFEENDGRLISKRLKEEAKKQKEFRKKCSTGGKRSAKKRWGKTDKHSNKSGYKGTGKEEITPQSSSSPSFSPSSSSSSQKVYLDRFEKIWLQYPNKDGKKAAKRHFLASVKTEEDWKKIQLALENYLNSRRVRGGFVKNGSGWFNGWRDWINFKEPKSEEEVKLDQFIHQRAIRKKQKEDHNERI